MPGARKTVRCTVALKPGDVVSAAAYSWGPAVAREHGDRGGRNDGIRIEGTVVEAKDNKWVCDFGDDTNIAWKRTELRFVSRPGEEAEAAQRGSKRSRPAPRVDSSDEEEATAEPEPTAGSDSRKLTTQGQMAQGLSVALTTQNQCLRQGWLQAPNGSGTTATPSMSALSTDGFSTKKPPSITNFPGGFENGSLFNCAKHFFPMQYLEAMAAEMTAVGRAKAEGEKGQRRYANWQVTSDDLLQWIGVWIYMLAFPQQASMRRSYFQAPVGGYGPHHNL